MRDHGAVLAHPPLPRSRELKGAPTLLRRNQATEPERPEAIEITLGDLATFERVLLGAARLRRIWTGEGVPGIDAQRQELIGVLYQRAGAVSVVQPDPQRARVPLFQSEFWWLESAIELMERYHGAAEEVAEARGLLNRFNALLGQARAVTHMGGTAVFDPDAPPPTLPALPAQG